MYFLKQDLSLRKQPRQLGTKVFKCPKMQGLAHSNYHNLISDYNRLNS